MALSGFPGKTAQQPLIGWLGVVGPTNSLTDSAPKRCPPENLHLLSRKGSTQLSKSPLSQLHVAAIAPFLFPSHLNYIRHDVQKRSPPVHACRRRRFCCWQSGEFLTPQIAPSRPSEPSSIETQPQNTFDPSQKYFHRPIEWFNHLGFDFLSFLGAVLGSRSLDWPSVGASANLCFFSLDSKCRTRRHQCCRSNLRLRRQGHSY